ncbi:MAG: zinc ribbon domain-containing protein [Bacteroidetes bacterium]|nr:zinc ribbon domain-containing protein [Bacteroidota bacterium]
MQCSHRVERSGAGNKCGYTSKDNHKTQSKFTCMGCGLANHADLKAFANVLQPLDVGHLHVEDRSR